MIPDEEAYLDPRGHWICPSCNRARLYASNTPDGKNPFKPPCSCNGPTQIGVMTIANSLAILADDCYKAGRYSDEMMLRLAHEVISRGGAWSARVAVDMDLRYREVHKDAP